MRNVGRAHQSRIVGRVLLLGETLFLVVFEKFLKGLDGNRHGLVVSSATFGAEEPIDGDEPLAQSKAAAAAELSWRRHRFRTLYDANFDDLWRYCLRRTRSVDEAEEALAETFAVAWRRLDDVPTGRQARPWLFGVARNQIRDRWRKVNRRKELTDRMVSTHIERRSIDPADLATDRFELILMAFSNLRDKDQEILRLAAWEELPHAEIATLLGCSENAVAIRLHRARGRLEKAIEKQKPVKGGVSASHVVVVNPSTPPRKRV